MRHLPFRSKDDGTIDSRHVLAIHADFNPSVFTVSSQSPIPSFSSAFISVFRKLFLRLFIRSIICTAAAAAEAAISASPTTTTTGETFHDKHP
jgi:hypothetical protein